MLGLFSMYSCSKEAPVTPNSEKTVLHQSVDSRSADGLTNSNVGDGDRINYPYAVATSFSAEAGDLSSNWTPTFDYSVITDFYNKTTINIYFRKPGATSWTFIATANRSWYSNATARFDVNKVYGWSNYPSYGETYFMATFSSNPPSTLPMTYNPEIVWDHTRINSNSSPHTVMHFNHPYF